MTEQFIFLSSFNFLCQQQCNQTSTENINWACHDIYVGKLLPPTFEVLKITYKAFKTFHIHTEDAKKYYLKTYIPVKYSIHNFTII